MLVVGGGALAAEKVRGLRAAGAAITVVAERLDDELIGQRDDDQIVHWAREYCDGDMAGLRNRDGRAGDAAANARLSQEARRRGDSAQRADDPANCDFILPAVVRESPLTIAIFDRRRQPRDRAARSRGADRLFRRRHRAAG